VSCHYVASIQPRAITGRHLTDCTDDECRGCQPCTLPHCRVCGVIHADHTCAGCLDETREALAEVVRLNDDLPTEAEVKGVEGEAMMLVGPIANPEAWRQRGRYGHHFDLEARLGENHPLWVLGTWELLYREAFGHDASAVVSIATASGYLERSLTYLATFPDIPFEDLARDIRSCRRHLEAVLHDGDQVDRGAPCMTCRIPLERVWGDDDRADGWRCPKCKRSSNDAQYRLAVAEVHRETAEWLTDAEMEIRTGVKAGTIRVWAQREKIARRRHSGRVEYLVADVEAQFVS